jgi:hypothetical protein
MHITRTLAAVTAVTIAVTACSPGTRNTAQTDTTAAAPDTAAAGAAAGAAADTDVAAAGATGLPAGYTGHTDRAGTNIADAKYVVRGDSWEVTTGPAHIVYAAKDSANGSYTATARFEQLQAPTHPEAFGLFVGGRDLDGPGQRYTYFLVRGTGEALVKVREGAQTRDVLAWKPNAAVSKADASGRATYRLAVRVGADSVRFLVDDKPVAAVAKSAVPTDGIAGLRINHNLHVRTGPVEVTR